MNTKKYENLTADNNAWTTFVEKTKAMEEICGYTDADWKELAREYRTNVKYIEEFLGTDDTEDTLATQFFQDTLIETLVFGGEKYNSMYRDLKCISENESLYLDIVLVNNKNIVIIKATKKILLKDVKILLSEKVAKLRRFLPEYQKHKIYLGIAGFSFSDAVREQAKKHGIGIIKQVGKSIEIDADKLKAY